MRARQSSHPAAAASPVHDPRSFLRYFLGRRRITLVLGSLMLIVGAAANWNWLAAIGIAPVVLSVLPCLAMCALGLCMNRMKGRAGLAASAEQEQTRSAEQRPTPPTTLVEASNTSAAILAARANRQLGGSSGEQGAAFHPSLEPQHQKRNTIDAQLD